ncbi:MAG: polysaccharide deacetylase family protein [Ignavibacteriaceae bacterium]
MEIKSRKWNGINQGLIILSGVTILAGSILIYLFILRGVFGSFNAAELVPNPKLLNNLFSGGKPDIGILYSKYTENMLPQGSTWLNDNINSWERVLNNAGYKYDVIADSTIELGLQYKYKLLILPGSKSLSDKEIVQLKKFISKGGSVFATSGTASYSDDGKWRGWDFFSQVFGLKFSKEISNTEVTKIHTLRGGLPITANIPAGYPLRVATWDRPISVEVLDPRTIQASFWYNYRLQGGLTRDKIKKSAGIVYGNYGYGRFVWMGFEINSVIGEQQDYIYFDRLFNNCMSWLTYQPIAFAKDWPSNYSAAAMLVPELSHNLNGVNNLLSILNSEKVKATFFVDPTLAEQNKGVIQSLTRYGEVGSLLDLGYLASATDTNNSLNDFDTQYQKLMSSRTSLEAITNSSVIGCMPFYGFYDQNTINALIKAKYKYVFSDSLTDRSVPQTIIRGDSLLVSMTKTGRDDYEVIRDFNLTQPDFQFYTYQEDIDRILFEGGLYVLKMHPDYQLKAQNIGVVKKVIDDLKKKKFWIATGSQIENWWARRNYVEVKATKRGDNRVAITISNPGKETMNGLVIQLDLNVAATNLALSSEIIGTKKAKYEYDPKNHIVYVYINDLEPSESRTYYIDYKRPNA